jgi:hypothetical protein
MKQVCARSWRIGETDFDKPLNPLGRNSRQNQSHILRAKAVRWTVVNLVCANSYMQSPQQKLDGVMMFLKTEIQSAVLPATDKSGRGSPW